VNNEIYFYEVDFNLYIHVISKNNCLHINIYIFVDKDNLSFMVYWTLK